MLLVYGSKDSLFPRICAVEAVGIGATSKLFLNPYLDKNTQFHELFSLLLQLANFKISEKMLFWLHVWYLQHLNKLFLHVVYVCCLSINVILKLSCNFLMKIIKQSHDFSCVIWKKEARVNLFKDHKLHSPLAFEKIYLCPFIVNCKRKIIWLPVQTI